MKKRSRSSDATECQEPEWDIQKIMKGIEFLSASHMSWKERKELENRKVVSLGGKATKKHRLVLIYIAFSPCASHMSWKERKELENRKVVSLGGKATKKHRLPLSVARPIMKKQKERTKKASNGSTRGGRARKPIDKRKPEDRVLKSTVGDFRNGVLDVKNMFKKPAPSRDDNSGSSRMMSEGKKGNKGGKKNNGKKQSGGGGRKRH